MSEQSPSPDQRPEPPRYSWTPEDEVQSPFDPNAYVEAEPPARPITVTVACVLTWLFSAVALIAAAWTFIAVNADRDGFERSIAEGDLENVNLTASDVADLFTYGSLGIALLSALAIVVTALAWRRTRWARIVLLLMSVVTSFASLLLSFAVFPFLWLLAALTVMILLMLGSAKRWFKA